MEIVYLSETSVNVYQVTERYIPEGTTLINFYISGGNTFQNVFFLSIPNTF
jgi:hypothetical protein